MRARFYTLDVFTDKTFGGNPLAVFPDAAKIPESALQSIALELNLSETVFVYPPVDPKHTRRVRIFTPVYEMPFAGHPTVGCAFALAALGEIPLDGDARIVLEEGVGPVPVLIRGEFKKPVFARHADREGVIRARVFVPGQGIIEDPATGSAVAALGGYLAARESATSGNFTYVVEQGFEIKRPSILELEVDKAEGEVTAVRVGGSAVMVSEGMMEVPLPRE